MVTWKRIYLPGKQRLLARGLSRRHSIAVHSHDRTLLEGAELPCAMFSFLLSRAVKPQIQLLEHQQQFICHTEWGSTDLLKSK